MTRFTHRRWRLASSLFVLLTFSASSQQFSNSSAANTESVIPGTEIFHYGAEWRLIRAGQAKLTHVPGETGAKANLQLQSTGLISKLYKVDDDYKVAFDRELCAKEIFLRAHEGRRRRETSVTFDDAQKKASYLERDTIKNTVVKQSEIDIPGCVYDVIGGLLHLRTMQIEIGQSANLNMSDGKKSVVARVEAQRREEVETPLGKYKAIRYEVFIFNDVLYKRKGRLFVWITDDDRRLPVQIRARMQFHVGTLTFQLEKEERL